jgi:hypothetical protein
MMEARRAHYGSCVSPKCLHYFNDLPGNTLSHGMNGAWTLHETCENGYTAGVADGSPISRVVDQDRRHGEPNLDEFAPG